MSAGNAVNAVKVLDWHQLLNGEDPRQSQYLLDIIRQRRAAAKGSQQHILALQKKLGRIRVDSSGVRANTSHERSHERSVDRHALEEAMKKFLLDLRILLELERIAKDSDA